MVAPAGFATTIMIARFANELCCGMVEMAVINELAFPTSRRYRQYLPWVRIPRRLHDTMVLEWRIDGAIRHYKRALHASRLQSLKQLLVEARGEYDIHNAVRVVCQVMAFRLPADHCAPGFHKTVHHNGILMRDACSDVFAKRVSLRGIGAAGRNWNGKMARGIFVRKDEKMVTPAVLNPHSPIV